MHVWWFCAFEMQVITTFQCCVRLNLKNLRESAPMLKSSNNMDVINIMLRFLILMWHLHSTVSNKSGLHLYPLYCFISVFFFSVLCMLYFKFKNFESTMAEYIWSVDQRLQNIIPYQYFQYDQFISNKYGLLFSCFLCCCFLIIWEPESGSLSDLFSVNICPTHNEQNTDQI